MTRKAAFIGFALAGAVMGSGLPSRGAPSRAAEPIGGAEPGTGSVVAEARARAGDDEILVLSFRNASSFKKPWNLAEDLPRHLAEGLEKKGRTPRYRKAPTGFYGGAAEGRKAALQDLCASTGPRGILFGTLREYGIAKNGIGTGAVAAFNRYGARAAGELSLYRCADDSLARLHLDLSLRDNEVGVRVPTVYIPLVRDKYEKTYRALESSAYGDSVFRQTVAGSLHDSLLSLSASLVSAAFRAAPPAAGSAAEAAAFPPGNLQGTPRRGYVGASVLLAKGREAYVDAGAGAGIGKGDSAGFFRRGDPILSRDGKDTLGYEEIPCGKGIVTEVKSEKLSIIEAENFLEKVVRGDPVRIYK